MVLGWCERAGFKPTIICVSDGIIHNLLWAKLGIGIALVPDFSKELVVDSGLIYKTVAEPTIATHTEIVWVRNRNLSASSKHFLNLFKEMIPGNGAGNQ